MQRPGYLGGFDDYGITPQNAEPEAEPSGEEALMLQMRAEIEDEAAKIKAQSLSGFGQYRRLSRRSYYPRRTGARVTSQTLKSQRQLQAQLDYARRLQEWQQQKHAYEMAQAAMLDRVAADAAEKAAAHARAAERRRARAARRAAAPPPRSARPPAPVIKKMTKATKRPPAPVIKKMTKGTKRT